MSEGTDAEIVERAIAYSYCTLPGDPQERYDAAEDRRAEAHAAQVRILAVVEAAQVHAEACPMLGNGTVARLREALSALSPNGKENG